MQSTSQLVEERELPELPPFDPQEPARVSISLDSALDWREELNQYVLGNQLGKGKHGDVYVCRDSTVEDGYDLVSLPLISVTFANSGFI